MGNCLAQQEKLIQVMKPDGKILEYKSPMRVHQVLSEFAGHAISQTLPVIKPLWPEAEMHAGQLYYLLPLPVPSLEFRNTRKTAGNEESRGLRIKLVIRRQDLEMLSKGGVSVEDMILQLQNQKLDGNCNRNYKGWKPALQTIPEAC
ncbi:hypothetical protein DCAR_0208753 [Daucus carota subsp. sativus]|uniref:Uncharacterized protein n=1 Tax=Daucus carota subsp. sativus TaxID=79200 RepID=A0A166ESE1_DAUCS|nr:PREDICTED: uncharacterized protein LOC108207744 [Daucus carota subsp. sativus]WOG89515.1 hypothetical protein DCAR_0208753 [Daucus carota subsp. sativus]